MLCDHWEGGGGDGVRIAVACPLGRCAICCSQLPFRPATKLEIRVIRISKSLGRPPPPFQSSEDGLHRAQARLAIPHQLIHQHNSAPERIHGPANPDFHARAAFAVIPSLPPTRSRTQSLRNAAERKRTQSAHAPAKAQSRQAKALSLTRERSRDAAIVYPMVLGERFLSLHLVSKPLEPDCASIARVPRFGSADLMCGSARECW